jgi:hypothetical protein
MKKVYFTLSAIFSVIALIVSFSNIGMSVPVAIFFDYSNMSLFFPMALMCVIGVFVGVFLTLALKAKDSPMSGGDDF